MIKMIRVVPDKIFSLHVVPLLSINSQCKVGLTGVHDSLTRV